MNVAADPMSRASIRKLTKNSVNLPDVINANFFQLFVL